MKKIKKKEQGKLKVQWIFLLMVILLYAVIGSAKPLIFTASLEIFFKIASQLLPSLLLVLLFLFTANLFMDSKMVAKRLVEADGVGVWITAILAGLLSTGPIFLWYPLLAELRDKGLKNPLLVVFLYNRAVKIPLIPVLVHYFGLTYTLVLTGYMMAFSVINGVVVGSVMSRGEVE